MTASNVDALTQSPFTFASQVIAHQGQRWEAVLTMPPMNRADGEQWIGFLNSLYGRTGTFLMGDPVGYTARGALGGTPLVNGANQVGSTLVIDGASNSITGWLLVGDYIQLGTGATSTLHKVLADADSDGSGNVTLEIWPALRSSPADNAAVTTTNARGVFRLATPSPNWDMSGATRYGISFAVVEVV